MKLIETKTLTTATDGLLFTAIPQTFTDLYVLVSVRAATSGQFDNLELQLNGTGSGFTSKRALYGTGSAVASYTGADGHIGYTTAASVTANTFGNASIYIPNYTSATDKSITTDAVAEINAATTALQSISANLWNNSAAITSLRVRTNGASMAAGSSVSLYGIGGAGDGYAPKATGGTISFANGYWVHTFTASGTFTPTANLTNVEYLVVAGGGGGGSWGGQYIPAGGGGAGGFRTATGQVLNLAQNYSVTVGAGGAGDVSGSNSVFNLTTSAGGGRGATGSAGASGGSGGGGAGAGNTPSTSPSQGNNGGTNAGGGGGAGADGSPNTSAAGGSGASSSITGSSVFYAGGGGSGSGPFSVTQGPGGAGGGGTGSASGPIGTTGTVNTGGGGGGGSGSQSAGQWIYGLAGGSGIVIVRYVA